MALFKNRTLSSAIEATEGVNVSPSLTTDAAVVLDLEINVEADEVEREISVPWLGSNEVVYTRKQVMFSFSVEMSGSGTAGTAPAWGRFVQGAGFSQTVVNSTVVYSPISTGFPSLTMIGNHDGNQFIGLGCRATSFEIECQVGEIPKFTFEFAGAYVPPTDVALPSPTYTGQAKPITFASGNTVNATLDGHAFCIEEFSLDLNLESNFRELVGCSKSTRISQRAVEGEILVERPNLLATKNLYTAIDAHTLVPLAFTHGTVAGNRVEISCPTLQLSYPEADDSEGILMHNYSFRAVPVSPGNNELTITVS
ncbi:MAG: phage tail tube protein [Cyanobacteriota bacterium]|nr:phage tail tube protein [Cyanobacteriota bacterium]